MSLEQQDGDMFFQPEIQIMADSADGTFISLKQENFLLYLTERNTENIKEAFELEVFLYEEDQNKYNQLDFVSSDTNMIDGYYIEGAVTSPELTPDYVEYYFNIEFDRNIPDEDLCKGIRNFKSDNILLNYDIKCPDREGFELSRINIYGSNVTEEDLEEC